jgi:hypothetical protein
MDPNINNNHDYTVYEDDESLEGEHYDIDYFDENDDDDDDIDVDDDEDDEENDLNNSLNFQNEFSNNKRNLSTVRPFITYEISDTRDSSRKSFKNLIHKNYKNLFSMNNRIQSIKQ